MTGERTVEPMSELGQKLPSGERPLLAQSGHSFTATGYFDTAFCFFGNGLARELELLPIAQGMQSYLRRAV